jgi:hypothetical protein
MALRTYAVGQAVRLSFEIRQNNVPIDPATLIIRVGSPSSVNTDYSLAGGTVTKDAVGLYHADIVPDAAGTWTYSAKTTTPTGVATNRTFPVVTSLFG